MSQVRDVRAKRNATIILLIILGALVVLGMQSCGTSLESLEEARYRGAAAGREDGRKAGEARGFKLAFEEHENVAFDEAVSGFAAAGKLQRSWLYCLLAGAAGVLGGWVAQYLIFYLLRRFGRLSDIDHIVLSPELLGNLPRGATNEPHGSAEKPLESASSE